MRSSLSNVRVDWTASSTPPPSMSSATHDVPLSDAAASAGPRAAPENDAVWHAERVTQKTTAENRGIGLTVVLDTAGARGGKTGPWARAFKRERCPPTRFTRRDET